MPPHILYEVPAANWTIRLAMGSVCLVFVLAIYGWWLPRATPALLKLRGGSWGARVVNIVVALIPLAIGVGPLGVLIMLIRNPMTYVTDTGVIKQNVFSSTPDSIIWPEVDHVSCQSQSNGSFRSISVFATDGRMIGFGNTGGVDFSSIYALLQTQLGTVVVHRCQRYTGRG